MKAVSNNSWGFDLETLTLTFNTLVKPVIGNCAPIWVPNVKPTHIAKIQTVQNRMLRLITGCHLASPIDYLHSEVGVLPVGIWLDMLCKQFVVRALRPAHPSHEVVLRHLGQRKNSKGRSMKETLSSKYLEAVQHFLHNGVMSQVSYKRTIQIIHSDTVNLAKNQQEINPLIGCKPPAVSITERKLTRPFRTVMRLLRSTQCSLLKSYQLKIKAVNDDVCPECQSASQTVLHLFCCPAYPTILNPIDLWYHPVDTARFLVTLRRWISPSPDHPQNPILEFEDWQLLLHDLILR
jgi:hypothetical protein